MSGAEHPFAYGTTLTCDDGHTTLLVRYLGIVTSEGYCEPQALVAGQTTDEHSIVPFEWLRKPSVDAGDTPPFYELSKTVLAAFNNRLFHLRNAESNRVLIDEAASIDFDKLTDAEREVLSKRMPGMTWISTGPRLYSNVADAIRSEREAMMRERIEGSRQEPAKQEVSAECPQAAIAACGLCRRPLHAEHVVKLSSGAYICQWCADRYGIDDTEREGKSDPLPTIGRIVHYVSGPGEEFAAIVTGAQGYLADLEVFGSLDRVPRKFPYGVVQSNDPTVKDSWHWPERG